MEIVGGILEVRGADLAVGGVGGPVAATAPAGHTRGRRVQVQGAEPGSNLIGNTDANDGHRIRG